MKKFWKAYSIYIGVLIVLCCVVIGYVKVTLNRYEDSQPENVVESQIKLIKEAALNNSLKTIINFGELKQLEYDKDISDYKEYTDKILNASNFTYEVKTGEYDENGMTFRVLADNEPVAYVSLESKNEQIKLGILKVSDWEVKSLSPIMTLMNYEYFINVPDESRVFINGHEITNLESTGDGWSSCEIKGLYAEPDIELYDSYGCLMDYDIKDNVVNPILHKYILSLPKDYTVCVGDKTTEGTLSDDKCHYNILTACESLRIKDTHGNAVSYTGNEQIYSYDYNISIPENYTITSKDVNIADYFIKEESNPKYKYCYDYSEMLNQNVYSINNIMNDINFEIKDNLGNNVDYEFDNGELKILKQAGLPNVPEYISEQVDVLDVAKTWSKFMTRDLSGSLYGFHTIKNYLVKDSYMYDVAYRWATGIDITLTSDHNSKDNYFENESVTNFVKYDDKLFSCDISFTKYMYLVRSNIWVDDITNSTFYFYNEGSAEKPHWVIVDIQEIVD